MGAPGCLGHKKSANGGVLSTCNKPSNGDGDDWRHTGPGCGCACYKPVALIASACALPVARCRLALEADMESNEAWGDHRQAIGADARAASKSRFVYVKCFTTDTVEMSNPPTQRSQYRYAR